MGMRDGSIRKCDPKLVSFAMAGAINWIGIWYDRAGPLKAKDIVVAFTEFLVDGVAAPKTEKPHERSGNELRKLQRKVDRGHKATTR